MIPAFPAISRLCIVPLWLSVAVLLSACGGGDQTGDGSGVGGIAVRAEWVDGSTVVTASRAWLGGSVPGSRWAAPPFVVTVRAMVSAADMDTVTQDFAAGAGSGQIDAIPAGTNRTVTLQGLDAVDVPIFEGAISGITVTGGQVTSAGTVTLNALNATPVPIVTSPAANPHFSNAVFASIDGICAGTGYTINMTGQEIAAQPCGGGSTFSFAGLTDPGIDGAYTYILTQTKDSSGVVSAAVNLGWTRDNIAPGLVTIDTLNGGAVSSPITTGGNSLTIAGSCETGAAVNLTGSAALSTTCAGSAYSIAVTNTTDNTYNFSLNQTDPAGNSAAPVLQDWIRDTAPPTRPTINQAPTVITNAGFNLTGNCTSTAAPHTVNLTGVQTSSVACGNAGADQYTIPISSALADGDYTLEVSQTRVATGVVSGSASVIWTLDKTPPANVVVTSPAIDPALNTSGGSTFNINGTCETLATVNLAEVAAISGVDATTATPCASAAFSFTVTKAVDALHDFAITQTDPAGNTSAGAVTVNWDRNSAVPPTPVITAPAANPLYANTAPATITVTCVGTNAVNMTGQDTQGPFDCSVGIAGEHTFAITDPGTDGTYIYRFTQTSGTTSPEAVFTLVLDNAPPGPVVVSNPNVTSATNSHTITGSCEDQATVNLTGASTKQTGCISLAFSFTVNQFANGTYNYFITQTDLAGNISLTATADWTRNVPQPVAPTITAPTSAPTLFSNTAITAIGGTCTSSTAHTVIMSGAQSGSVACASGAYSIPVANPGTDGSFVFVVVQSEDATGTGSNSDSLNWTLDTVAPAQVVLTLPGSSTLTSSEDTLTISGFIPGSCENGSSVQLFEGLVEIDSVPSCSGQSFTFTVDKTGAASPSTFNFSVVQTDQAGNASDPAAITCTRDTSVPPAPIVTLVNGAPAANPFISGANPASITVSCIDGNHMDLGGQESQGDPTLPAFDCAAGTFTFPLATPPTVDGIYSYLITQTDNVLGTISGDASLTYIKDSTGPDTPTVVTPAGSPALFIAPGPLTISGACEVNATVTITGGTAPNPAPFLCSAATYSFTFDEAGDNTYAYNVQQTDLAGLTSGSAAVNWQRQSDATPPVVITVPSVNPLASNSDTLTILGTCITGFRVTMTERLPVLQTAIEKTCQSSSFSFLIDKTVDPDATFVFEFTQDNGGTLSSVVSQTWTRDQSLPDLTVTYKPVDDGGTLTPTNPTRDSIFEFESTDGTAIFECKLDTGSFAACVSPKTYPGLTGSHTVDIRAKDAAGNIGTDGANLPARWTQRTNDTVVLYGLDDPDLNAATPEHLADESFYTNPVDALPVEYANTLTTDNTSATKGVTGSFAEGWPFDGTPVNAEVSDVTAFADIAGSLGGTWFSLNSASNATAYYVWYDVDNLSTDPAPAGKTAIEVNITSGETANNVAAASRAAIGAIVADFTTGGATNAVTITNAANGAADDVADGAAPTGFVFIVTTQGGISEYLATADNATHRAFRSTMTVEAWVKFDPVAVDAMVNKDQMPLIRKYNTAGGKSWQFGLEMGGGGNKAALYFRGVAGLPGGGTTEVSARSQFVINVDAGPVLDPAGFVHVAATWDRGVVSLFFDGMRKKGGSIGTSGVSLLEESTAPLVIGADELFAGNNEVALGAIVDEVRISQTVRYTGNFTPLTPPDLNNPPYAAD